MILGSFFPGTVYPLFRFFMKKFYVCPPKCGSSQVFLELCRNAVLNAKLQMSSCVLLLELVTYPCAPQAQQMFFQHNI